MENPTPSIDGYLDLLEKQSSQISPRLDLKRCRLTLFWRWSPQQQQQEE